MGEAGLWTAACGVHGDPLGGNAVCQLLRPAQTTPLTCSLAGPSQHGRLCALGHRLASELPQTQKSNFLPSTTVCSKATSFQEAFQKVAQLQSSAICYICHNTHVSIFLKLFSHGEVCQLKSCSVLY